MLFHTCNLLYDTLLTPFYHPSNTILTPFLHPCYTHPSTISVYSISSFLSPHPSEFSPGSELNVLKTLSNTLLTPSYTLITPTSVYLFSSTGGLSGAELNVLKTVNWDEVMFDVLCVELEDASRYKGKYTPI